MASERGPGISDFFARFPDEAACLAHIVAVRWGDHSPCPNCGELGRWSQIRNRKKWLHSCRSHLTPLKDTVFYRSNLSMMAWFYALLLFANSSSGVRTSFVRKQLGLGHRSSFRLCRMIRVHMATMPRPARLGGPDKIVHIDEAHLRYLAVPGSKTRGAALVLGMACEGQVLSGIIPDRRAETIIPLILDRVVPGSTVVTDAYRSYHALERHGYRHVQINHSVAFHDFKGNTNNPIEAYWATVKRTLSGYRQISADNLWTYLAEIEFRYNRRSRKPEIFDELVTHFRPYLTDLEEDWQRLFDWTPRLKSTAPSRANQPSGFCPG